MNDDNLASVGFLLLGLLGVIVSFMVIRTPFVYAFIVFSAMIILRASYSILIGD